MKKKKRIYGKDVKLTIDGKSINTEGSKISLSVRGMLKFGLAVLDLEVEERLKLYYGVGPINSIVEWHAGPWSPYA